MYTTKPKNVLSTYRARVSAFRPNARLYLSSTILTGAALGVYRLLFNFYALSLGMDESILGRLITAGNFTALLAALPMGYLADSLGRKRSLLLGGGLTALSILVMVLWPSQGMFYLMNVVMGLAQSLAAVSVSPFLVENSGEEERTYLFSLNQGLQMTAASVGNWIGGLLPSWIAARWDISPTSAAAYAGSLAAVACVAFLGLSPLLWLKSPNLTRSQRTVFAPFAYAAKEPLLLGKLILPMLLTSIGAGLIMPFMNVFFRVVHHQPDPVIGALFAWGSLAMGIGILVAPPLADRLGKIQIVVSTQALSIPFLILLGFSPWFWAAAFAYYIRLALMNMGGPVYNAYVMEKVEPSARATVASLVSMSWNFGWAFSPTISGWAQVRYGFGPSFLGTIFLYAVSVFLYWAFFWRGEPKTNAEEA
ncbi:MAG: MFS transporter [Candidatus Villigracilaceae bacterium]